MLKLQREEEINYVIQKDKTVCDTDCPHHTTQRHSERHCVNTTVVFE